MDGLLRMKNVRLETTQNIESIPLETSMHLVLRGNTLLMISLGESLSGPERNARRPIVSIQTMTMAPAIGAGNRSAKK